MSDLQRTVLFDQHTDAGARMMGFAGWEMPLQYAGTLEEYRAVRGTVGVFDISHMGKFFVGGPAAGSWLDRVLTNRLSTLETGAARYTFLLNEQGGVIDDLYVYRIQPEKFLLIVNAAKTAEDFDWMSARLDPGVEFSNSSAEYSALAVQGPGSPAVFRKCFGRDVPTARNRTLEFERGGEPLWVATTGYTGEVGFEVVFRNADAPSLWRALLTAGCQPCGLGARDLLRLEMAYPLNGADLSPHRTPLEAGLGFFVDLAKEDFVGKAALDRQKAEGVPCHLCALAIQGKSPPVRAHYPVFSGERQIGETTSGGLSPTLGVAIALAYLPTEFAKRETPVEVGIRDRRYPARVTKKPFLTKEP